MKQLRTTLALTILLLAPTLAAHGAGERLFGLTNLWTFHLTLSEADWRAMEPIDREGAFGRPQPEARPDRPAGTGAGERVRGPRPPGPGAFDREYPWATCTFEDADVVLTNVAIRFKGNSSFNVSRGTLKRPFKLDFNRGAKGRTFLGVEELLLNNNFNDATQLREALAYEACRRAGLPAPRTAFARVFLSFTDRATNQFLGLYTLVEAVDEEFLKVHFGSKKGLLLKPERLRGLEYLGEDWRAYPNRYEPKTESKPADTAAFMVLTRLIAEADDASFARELPTRMDVDHLLRFIAVTAVLANYDSFVGNGHNYYLFQARTDRKVRFIPWDLNEAFGGHPGAGRRLAQAEFSVLRPQAGPNRLIERVLANPNWAAAYRREVAALLTNACAPDRLLADAERIARVTPAAVFAESEFARASFQRIALGQTNVALPWRDPGLRGPGGGGGQPFGPRPDRPPGDGPMRRTGGGLGPGPGGPEEMTLANWITLRMKNVADELAGNRAGTIPRMQRGPGGPAGPNGPRRPGQPQ